jgi:hypothetical protein
VVLAKAFYRVTSVSPKIGGVRVNLNSPLWPVEGAILAFPRAKFVAIRDIEVPRLACDGFLVDEYAA